MKRIASWLRPSSTAPHFSARGMTLVLFMAVAVYASELILLSRQNGFELDELVSLILTEPSSGFGSAFADMSSDSNPPLYYLLLYFVRKFVADDSRAYLGLNILTTMLAAATVALGSRKAGIPRTGMACIAAMLLTGPVLRFTLEARAYLMAIQIVFVVAWYGCVAVQLRRSPGTIRFVVIGGVAALTHVFAALMCGSIAAGVIVVAMLDRRYDLWKSGLALGMAATAALVAWYAHGVDASRIDWIKFDLASVAGSASEVGELAVGGGGQWLKPATIMLLVALCGGGLASRTTRSMTIACVLAVAFFILVPVVVSYRLPIITGRYWAVGYPLVVVYVIFLCTAWYWEGPSQKCRSSLQVASMMAAAFIAMSDVVGFDGARASIAWKKLWKGASIVADNSKDCQSESIHVLSWRRPYSRTSGLPVDVFVNAEIPGTAPTIAAQAKCRVLGWAEHNARSMAEPEISDQEILAALKIQASPAEIEIRRHRGGFVVLRKN